MKPTKKRKKNILLLKFKTAFLAVFTSALLFSNSNAFANEAYGFAHKESDATTLCKNGEAQGWANAAWNWISVMDDHARWSTTSWDSYIQGVEFCDYSQARPSCHDHDDRNLDHGDAALYSTHGGWSGGNGLDTCGTYIIKMSSEYGNYPISTSMPCWATSANWVLGDNDVEMISAFGCMGAQYSAYFRDYVKDMTQKLHQWHGYHGTSSTGANNLTDDFADDAFDGSIAVAWADKMTVIDFYPDGADICAVSWVMGEDGPDCNSRIVNETYAWFDDDPPPTGEYARAIFPCNCDPPGPSKWTLPSC